MKPNLFRRDVTITGTTSTPLLVDGVYTLVALVMPAAWDAADIHVQQSMDTRSISDPAWVPTTWADAYDDANSRVTINVAAGRYINIAQNLASNHLRLISSVSQSSPRVVGCIIREIA